MIVRALRRHLTAGRVAAVVCVLLVVGVLTPVLVDDSPDIEETLKRIAIDETGATCDELHTTGYLVQTTLAEPAYADEACERYVSAGGAVPVEVGEVEVSGDRATARASYPSTGTTVEVGLVEEDGVWKLDEPLDYTVDDRQAFEDDYRADLVPPAGPYSERAADCMLERVGRLPTPSLERALEPASLVLARQQIDCDRAGFERYLTSALAVEGVPLVASECVQARAADLGDSALARLLVRPSTYFELVQACDPDWLTAAYVAKLSGSGAPGGAVDCVREELEGQPPGERVSAVYDDSRREALLLGCDLRS